MPDKKQPNKQGARKPIDTKGLSFEQLVKLGLNAPPPKKETSAR